MAKPHIVGLGEWNQMVHSFHDESDRGAAILAGSFAEHALGTYLMNRVVDKRVGDKLFGSVGPLSSFSQRIAAAYAFGLITRAQYDEFESIRQARNHFAHHPLDASFESSEVQKHTVKLGIFKNTTLDIYTELRVRHRMAYLLGCGHLCGSLLGEIEAEEVNSTEKSDGKA